MNKQKLKLIKVEVDHYPDIPEDELCINCGDQYAQEDGLCYACEEEAWKDDENNT